MARKEIYEKKKWSGQPYCTAEQLVRPGTIPGLGKTLSALARCDRIESRKTLLDLRTFAVRAGNFLLLGFSQSQDFGKRLMARQAQILIGGHVSLSQSHQEYFTPRTAKRWIGSWPIEWCERKLRITGNGPAHDLWGRGNTFAASILR